MSFFDGDVVAKEQVHGVLSTPPAPVPVPPTIISASLPPRARRKPKSKREREPPKDLLKLIHDYLEIKVRRRDEA